VLRETVRRRLLVLQEDPLKQAECKRVFTDRCATHRYVSGGAKWTAPERVRLMEALKFMRPGNTLTDGAGPLPDLPSCCGSRDGRVAPAPVPSRSLPEAIMTPLLNEITTLPHPVVRVRDDYHLIEAPRWRPCTPS
jgi:hypothetical protein